jgi:hypothetical protein
LKEENLQCIPELIVKRHKKSISTQYEKLGQLHYVKSLLNLRTDYSTVSNTFSYTIIWFVMDMTSHACQTDTRAGLSLVRLPPPGLTWTRSCVVQKTRGATGRLTANIYEKCRHQKPTQKNRNRFLFFEVFFLSHLGILYSMGKNHNLHTGWCHPHPDKFFNNFYSTKSVIKNRF